MTTKYGAMEDVIKNIHIAELELGRAAKIVQASMDAEKAEPVSEDMAFALFNVANDLVLEMEKASVTAMGSPLYQAVLVAKDTIRNYRDKAGLE
jgi:hypothetical protein